MNIQFHDEGLWKNDIGSWTTRKHRDWNHSIDNVEVKKLSSLHKPGTEVVSHDWNFFPATGLKHILKEQNIPPSHSLVASSPKKSEIRENRNEMGAGKLTWISIYNVSPIHVTLVIAFLESFFGRVVDYYYGTRNLRSQCLYVEFASNFCASRAIHQSPLNISYDSSSPMNFYSHRADLELNYASSTRKSAASSRMKHSSSGDLNFSKDLSAPLHTEDCFFSSNPSISHSAVYDNEGAMKKNNLKEFEKKNKVGAENNALWAKSTKCLRATVGWCDDVFFLEERSMKGISYFRTSPENRAISPPRPSIGLTPGCTEVPCEMNNSTSEMNYDTPSKGISPKALLGFISNFFPALSRRFHSTCTSDRNSVSSIEEWLSSHHLPGNLSVTDILSKGFFKSIYQRYVYNWVRPNYYNPFEYFNGAAMLTHHISAQSRRFPHKLLSKTKESESYISEYSKSCPMVEPVEYFGVAEMRQIRKESLILPTHSLPDGEWLSSERSIPPISGIMMKSDKAVELSTDCDRSYSHKQNREIGRSKVVQSGKNPPFISTTELGLKNLRHNTGMGVNEANTLRRDEVWKYNTGHSDPNVMASNMALEVGSATDCPQPQAAISSLAPTSLTNAVDLIQHHTMEAEIINKTNNKILSEEIKASTPSWTPAHNHFSSFHTNPVSLTGGGPNNHTEIPLTSSPYLTSSGENDMEMCYVLNAIEEWCLTTSSAPKADLNAMPYENDGGRKGEITSMSCKEVEALLTADTPKPILTEQDVYHKNFVPYSTNSAGTTSSSHVSTLQISDEKFGAIKKETTREFTKTESISGRLEKTVKEERKKPLCPQETSHGRHEINMSLPPPRSKACAIAKAKIISEGVGPVPPNSLKPQATPRRPSLDSSRKEGWNGNKESRKKKGRGGGAGEASKPVVPQKDTHPSGTGERKESAQRQGVAPRDGSKVSSDPISKQETRCEKPQKSSPKLFFDDTVTPTDSADGPPQPQVPESKKETTPASVPTISDSLKRVSLPHPRQKKSTELEPNPNRGKEEELKENEKSNLNQAEGTRKGHKLHSRVEPNNLKIKLDSDSTEVSDAADANSEICKKNATKQSVSKRKHCGWGMGSTIVERSGDNDKSQEESQSPKVADLDAIFAKLGNKKFNLKTSAAAKPQKSWVGVVKQGVSSSGSNSTSRSPLELQKK